MSHYFTDNRNLDQNRKEIPFRFLGIYYTFITDNGVFSKTEVDFGTWVLLKEVCQREIGHRVLDLGCGYGVVGVVCKTQFPQSAMVSVDSNPRAVELTQLNAVRAKIEVEALVSDGYTEVEGTFSTIITNPPIRAGKKVIYDFFEQAYDYLEDEGSLWVVIRKQQGAPSAKKKIEEVFGNCDLIKKDKGYWVLKATKKTLTD
ncbi:MAG: class I SAM-dependent methyltransferase [Anaerorhabdus sp.]